MNDFLDNFGKVMGETAKKAIKASGDVVELTKTSLNIKFDEIKRESFFKEIGRIVYNAYKISPESANNEIFDFCKCIEEIENSINNQKAKAAGIKNRKFCVHCGIILCKSVNYCHSCGAKQPEIINEEDCCDCGCQDGEPCECDCECEDDNCDCGCGCDADCDCGCQDGEPCECEDDDCGCDCDCEK